MAEVSIVPQTLEIATEAGNDEDYTWLTERLDALQSQQTTAQQSLSSEMESLRAAMSDSQSQSRLLLETQAKMIQSLSLSQTELISAALSRLTPPNSTNISEQIPEPEPAIVTEVQLAAPDAPAQTPDSPASNVAGKKRRRI